MYKYSYIKPGITDILALQEFCSENIPSSCRLDYIDPELIIYTKERIEDVSQLINAYKETNLETNEKQT